MPEHCRCTATQRCHSLKKHRDCYNVHWQIPWTCEGCLVQDQYVSVANLRLIKKLKSISPHKVKSDPTDARRITSYTRDNWSELRLYSNMGNTRSPYKHEIYNSDSLWRKTLLWKETWSHCWIKLIPVWTNSLTVQLTVIVAKNDGLRLFLMACELCPKSSLKVFTERYRIFCKSITISLIFPSLRNCFGNRETFTGTRHYYVHIWYWQKLWSSAHCWNRWHLEIYPQGNFNCIRRYWF